ncbi:hypothetical protein JQC67_13345 [Aurantibacter crassamenti]|uniref:hypothetical protein n=1 Tax=Aurantibacter crassamenti TaxID=1837375 RepID=UPI00193ABF1F|nr:hypothetical protein [Aurantibacter crassamenti]MBM1107132.1 hypothetical protein [Aurantibacter crassamenti]
MTLRRLIRPVSFFLFLLFSTTSIGQEKQKFSGPIEIGNYSGIAKYQYFVSENDTILDGAFEMQKSNLGDLLTNADETFSFTGQFKNNHANGLWNFDFGEFKSDSLTEVIGFQYKINISGLQEKAKGNLKMGKPDGLWHYSRNQIKNSELLETLFESSIEFDNGIPQKSFKIKNTEGTVVGRFLRDGLAHDEWTFYSEKQLGNTESWFFTNGELQKISTVTNEQSDEIKLSKVNNASKTIINFDSRYIKLISLTDNGAQKILANASEIPNLLAENAEYYKKLDTILSSLGEAAFLPEFKVKVAYYPLDSLERKNLHAISESYKRSDSISTSFLTDTQLNILKLSDEEANYYYAVIDSISKQYLHPIKEILKLNDDNILEYVDRNFLVQHVLPNGFPSKEINIILSEGVSKSFSDSTAKSFTFSEKSLSGILQMTKYAESSLNSIEKVLEPKLAKERRQQEFIAIEEQMISQIKNLNGVIDSVDSKFPKELISALEQIKSVANKNLSKYSNMQNLEEKLDFGQHLTNCFTHLEQLEKEILTHPTKNQEIVEHYQDQVWNPFMANLMTEEIKKRITGAYRKVLEPYLINEVNTNLDCTNAATLLDLYKATHERMLTLRDEDTHKLERKLKREQDPKMVLELMNINPTVKKEQ